MPTAILATETLADHTKVEASSSSSASLVWSAIIGAALASLSYEILLNFLGVGLGLATFDLDTVSLFKMGAWAIAWLTISGIIAMSGGGWIAGRFCKSRCAIMRAYHGLMAWSIATLLSVMISLSGAGIFVGGVIGTMENSISLLIHDANPITSMINYSKLSDKVTEPQTQENLKQKVEEINNNLGKVGLIMFVAFLLSALGSVGGAIVGGRAITTNKRKDL